MGTAYFIVLEREIDGVDTRMDGKSLARHVEALDQAARDLGVRPLSDFFSADPTQLAEIMESEGVDSEDFAPPALQQFSAEDGLGSIRALVSHAVAGADGVALDLGDCERVLAAAAQHGVGWHFDVDF